MASRPRYAAHHGGGKDGPQRQPPDIGNRVSAIRHASLHCLRVYPHVPDAIWAYEFDPEKKESATNKEKLGAEFPFTRFFYEYKEPEKADDLLARFMELEKSLSEKIAVLQESEGV